MPIYLQKIETRWTKESRGNPGASLRNKVPEKLPFIDAEVTNKVVLHEITYHEVDSFQTGSEKLRYINDIQVRQEGLAFEEINDALVIWYWSKTNNKKKLGTLPVNTWCQWKTNFRYPMEHTWGYTKQVYSIFFGELNQAKNLVRKNVPEFTEDHQTLLI